MKVLVTGASGFLGSHAAEAFIRRGDEVVALVRGDSQTGFLKSLGIVPVRSALDDPATLRNAMQAVDVVIHAAARVDSYGFWRDFRQVTIEGTRQVLGTAIDAGVPQFIHISSSGVYENSRSRGEPYRESQDYGAPYRWSYYGRAKIEAERIVREAGDAGRIHTTILRPTWIYGPRDVTIFERVASALRARRFKWIGDATNKLNLVYVTDVANAIVLAATKLEARDRIYNVADDEHSVTQKQFITRICELLGLPLPASTVSRGLAHNLGFLGECVAHATGFSVRPPLTRLSVLLLAGDRRFPNEKLRSELGWNPAVAFDDGIQRTATWHKNRPQPVSV